MHYKHLTREERYTISCLRSKGHPSGFIATQLGRDKSTINRETKRNAPPGNEYRFCNAEGYASKKSREASFRSRRVDTNSWSFAVETLATEQWSPDQISADLKRSGRPPISHETICNRIHADKERGGTLHSHLRHRIGCYESRLLKSDKRGRIKNQRSIEDRPAVVEEKNQSR